MVTKNSWKKVSRRLFSGRGRRQDFLGKKKGKKAPELGLNAEGSGKSEEAVLLNSGVCMRRGV